VTETAKPKRRGFQFSLRTLFIVLTLVGIWLGYHVNWIRQRHRFYQELWWKDDNLGFFDPKPFPWSLRLLGESPKLFLVVPKQLVPEAESLFPEATIVDTAMAEEMRVML
jgi:hypothetical protein